MQGPRGLPVLQFDWRDEGIRQIAENIFHAQHAGWPSVLTYNAERDQIVARMKRQAAMIVTLEDVDGVPGAELLAKDIRENGPLRVPTIRNSDPKLNLPSRDEYPFACTKEHTGKVWIGHVLPVQNSRQGGMLSSFLKQHSATDGFRFEVRVLNYPSF